MASKESERKIAQLQTLEQNIQNVSLQKQNFQSQLIEVENALLEIRKTSGQAYKIIGAIMVASKTEDLKKELEGKKEVLNLRINSIEKQENQQKERAASLQKEVLAELKEDDKQ